MGFILGRGLKSLWVSASGRLKGKLLGPAMLSTVGSPRKSWVAVKERELSYHNRYILQCIWFAQYSSLN